MSGEWKRSMVGYSGTGNRKGRPTRKATPTPPRHSSTLLSSLKQATISTQPPDRSEAQRRTPQTALPADHKPPEDWLLIDSRQAAKLLNFWARTLWRMQHTGSIPPPIRIGRTVRWSLATLNKWVEEGVLRTMIECR